MHMKDPKFVALIAEMIRLQRATAIMAELATQGTGLTDMGDQNLKEQVNEVCLQLMRMTDHTATLAGYKGAYKPSDLPRLPGMMLMVDGQGEPVPYRSTFVPRDPHNPDSLAYKLRQPSDSNPLGEPILFAPTLPPETIAVFEEHGLMDLWELGKTKSGRERLQSEADPVQSTGFPTDLAFMLTAASQGAGAAASKPKMEAGDVVLAMLKHEHDHNRPGLTVPELTDSPWWSFATGRWTKTGSNPDRTSITRACGKLSATTEEQVAAGVFPLIASDGGKPAPRWSITAAGVERGEQMLNLLRSAGALGPQGSAQQAASSSESAAEIERKAMLAAEQAALIETLMREASASLGGQ